MTNDPRIIELARLAAEIAGPGSEFFIAVAFHDRPGIATMSNIESARQPVLLRVLLKSFESGDARECEVVALHRKPVDA